MTVLITDYRDNTKAFHDVSEFYIVPIADNMGLFSGNAFQLPQGNIKIQGSGTGYFSSQAAFFAGGDVDDPGQFLFEVGGTPTAGEKFCIRAKGYSINGMVDDLVLKYEVQDTDTTNTLIATGVKNLFNAMRANTTIPAGGSAYAEHLPNATRPQISTSLTAAHVAAVSSGAIVTFEAAADGEAGNDLQFEVFVEPASPTMPARTSLGIPKYAGIRSIGGSTGFEFNATAEETDIEIDQQREPWDTFSAKASSEVKINLKQDRDFDTLAAALGYGLETSNGNFDIYVPNARSKARLFGGVLVAPSVIEGQFDLAVFYALGGSGGSLKKQKTQQDIQATLKLRSVPGTRERCWFAQYRAGIFTP